VPILSASAQFWLDERGAGSWVGSTVSSPRSRRRLVNAVVMVAFVVFTILRVRVVIRDQPKTEAQHFPAGTVSFLARQRPPGPILNNYNWGGYFIANCTLSTGFSLMAAPTCTAIPLWMIFYATYHLTEGWKRPIEQWQIRTILRLRCSPRTALRSQPGWKQILFQTLNLSY